MPIDQPAARLVLHLLEPELPDSLVQWGLFNAVFERKSYVMRRMLGPLARGGLIISDGEIWRKRRKLVSPIIHASTLSVFAPVMADTARETA